MSNLAKNLSLVKEKISNAYLKRAVELRTREPRLVAVSKTKPVELIIEAYNCGQRHFGENYVQEIVEKGFDEELLKVCPDIKWHFIGHLQKNKVNKLLSVPNLYIIETVDNEKIAQAIDERLKNFKENSDERLNVFIQVNTSGEEAKSGCSPNQVVELVSYAIENCPRLSVKGLMTIGRLDNRYQPGEVNPDFQTLIDCRLKVCRDLNIDVNDFELSMGMSGDFEHAVEVGATNVRVGSLIFGERAGTAAQQINRYRKVHRVLKFYSNNFGFRKPYQVLIDGTICVAALKNQIKIEEQFAKYLDGDVKLLTTQCILKEVESLGPATFGAFLIIKKFGVHQCGHGKCPVPAADCILSMIGESNASRYIIASQDRELQRKCRLIRGVPLLYLHSRTPVLESPSTFTQEAASEKSLGSFAVSEFEKEKLDHLNKDEGTEERPPRKRKKKGGPNPLSCKKKKKKPGSEQGSKPKEPNEKKKKKRKRKRSSRLVKMLKSEVLANLNS